VTAWRISKTAEFKTEYRKARAEAYAQTVARLQQASGAAVSTLLKVMVEKTTPPASRVRAADCVLDRATKAMELEDIEAPPNRFRTGGGSVQIGKPDFSP